MASLSSGQAIEIIGRETARFRQIGADVMIPLVDDEAALEESFRPEFAVDVVIDYLWEERRAPADRRGQGRKGAVPIRFVQIGAVSGPDITLPSAALRSSAIVLMEAASAAFPSIASSTPSTGCCKPHPVLSDVACRATTAPGAPCSSRRPMNGAGLRRESQWTRTNTPQPMRAAPVIWLTRRP